MIAPGLTRNVSQRTEQAPSRDEKHPPGATEGKRHEILGLITLSVAILLALALASYDMHGSRNWCGPVGNGVAESLVVLLGSASLMIAWAILVVSVRLFRKSQRPLQIPRMLGTGGIIVALACGLHLSFGEKALLGGLPAGGLIGTSLGEWMRSRIGEAGAHLVTLTCLLIALIVRTRLSIVAVATGARAAGLRGTQAARQGMVTVSRAWRKARDEDGTDREAREKQDAPRVEPIEKRAADAVAEIIAQSHIPVSEEEEVSESSVTPEALVDEVTERPMYSSANNDAAEENTGLFAHALSSPSPWNAVAVPDESTQEAASSEPRVASPGPRRLSRKMPSRASRTAVGVELQQVSTECSVSVPDSQSVEAPALAAVQTRPEETFPDGVTIQASGNVLQVALPQKVTPRRLSKVRSGAATAVVAPEPPFVVVQRPMETPVARIPVEVPSAVTPIASRDDESLERVSRSSVVPDAAPQDVDESPMVGSPVLLAERPSTRVRPSRVNVVPPMVNVVPNANAVARAPVQSVSLAPSDEDQVLLPAELEALVSDETIAPDPHDEATSGVLQIISHEQDIESARRVAPVVGNVTAGPRGPVIMPSTDLLAAAPVGAIGYDEEHLRASAERLVKTLKDYGIEGRVVEVHPGPVVTTFEFVPAAGIKLSKIARLGDDIAMNLEANRVRIVAPIPGKGRVGFEIPNPKRQTVFLREMLETDAFGALGGAMPVALGKDVVGAPFFADIAAMPHLIVAGATGAGKSVGLNVMLASLLYKRGPEDVRMLMIDPKVVELAVYDGIPHMLLPVVTDMKKAALALRWVVDEMERRYALFAQTGARNITTYNDRVLRAVNDGVPMKGLNGPVRAKDNGTTVQLTPADAANTPASPNKLPYILVVVDEFADLMMVAGKEVEAAVARLAQKARAAGIHVILATQRPSVDVITGVIKANFPSRIAFKVSQRVDSRTILDQQGAEHLLGRGDMLILPPGSSDLKRVHCAFVGEEEIQSITDHWRKQGVPTYDEEILRPRDEDGQGDDAEPEIKVPQEKYERAVALVLSSRRCSVSWVQRQLAVGYNVAARMVEKMEREGIVGAPKGPGKDREVLG